MPSSYKLHVGTHPSLVPAKAIQTYKAPVLTDYGGASDVGMATEQTVDSQSRMPDQWYIIQEHDAHIGSLSKLQKGCSRCGTGRCTSYVATLGALPLRASHSGSSTRSCSEVPGKFSEPHTEPLLAGPRTAAACSRPQSVVSPGCRPSSKCTPGLDVCWHGTQYK